MKLWETEALIFKQKGSVLVDVAGDHSKEPIKRNIVMETKNKILAK